ncbi:MAG TPA: 30S ribosomal protein S20 [Candidatus Dormibacteraeota bacterium]
MANIASSKKDARRSAVRAVANRAVRSSVKTKVAKFRRGTSEGGEELVELAERAISGLDRAAAKGVLHRNNAARRKSRLMKRLNALSAPATEAAEKPAAKQTAKGRAKKTAPAKAAAAKTQAKARSAAKPASRAAASKRKS